VVDAGFLDQAACIDLISKTMREAQIRPIAICICRDGERILVAEGRDHKRNRVFYRPLGGTIEFGEPGAQAVRREFREELDAELTDIRYLGTLENIFTYEGRHGHEIVLVYDGRLSEDRLYAQESLQGDEFGQKFKAVWKRLDEFERGGPPVYPEGLLELIRGQK
jgi:8-oxo-dGTP pyrophosphatase MutT (NUDIX family)